MISIEQQIRSGLIISLLVFMSLLAVFADYAVNRLSQDFVTTRLQHDTDNLINALSLNSEGVWELDSQRLTPVYQRVKSGHYFQVIFASQAFRSRSLWDKAPAVDPIASGQTRQQQQFMDEEHWLIWQQGIELQGQPVTLWVAEDIAPFEKQWRNFSIIMYAVMLMTVILLVLLQRYLLTRGFSRISVIQQAIRQLQQGEIEALTTQVPREIQPLTQEINYLLKRLEQRITRSRSAMGNLAHELKRYIQHLHLLRDTLPDESKTEYDQALLQISQLTERELKRARIAGTPHPGRRFSPAQDLPHMIRLLERIYPQTELQLVLETPEMPDELPYDRDDMLELIGNLLDNGCKFSAAKVGLRLALTASALRVIIEDDGAGVSTELCRQLTERGTRIDESVAGHGLGLSICKMISDSYLGEMCFSSDPTAGLFRVEVNLPFNTEVR